MKSVKFRLVQDDKVVGYEKHILSCGTVSIMHQKTEEDIWYYIYPAYKDWIPHNHKDIFTGLKDKNGKDLDWWEGDLFRINGVIYKLIFDAGCYFLDGIKTPYRLRAADVVKRPNGNVPIVIGNKWENPELLE